MSTDSRLNEVERFYDFHPISAQQILAAVAAPAHAAADIQHLVVCRHCSTTIRTTTAAPLRWTG